MGTVKRFSIAVTLLGSLPQCIVVAFLEDDRLQRWERVMRVQNVIALCRVLDGNVPER